MASFGEMNYEESQGQVFSCAGLINYHYMDNHEIATIPGKLKDPQSFWNQNRLHLLKLLLNRSLLPRYQLQ